MSHETYKDCFSRVTPRVFSPMLGTTASTTEVSITSPPAAQMSHEMPESEYDRLKAQKEAIVDREQRRIEGALAANDVLQTLAERARWYRDGCDGLEDRESYYASGDVARDAAGDLETALSEIRVLERVIALMRGHRPPTTDVVTIDAVKAAIGFLNMPQREMVLERLGKQEATSPPAADTGRLVEELETLATDDSIPDGQRRWRIKLVAERLAVLFLRVSGQPGG